MLFFFEAIKNSHFIRRNKERFHLYEYKKKKYCGFSQQNIDGNQIIKDLINSGKPFFIARMGDSELKPIKESWLVGHHLKRHINTECLRYLKIGPGVFPNSEEYVKTFRDIYLNGLSNADYLFYWYLPYEEYCVKNYSKSLTGIIPFSFAYPGKNDWTKCLKNKKVLVVSAFAESIEKQYKKRKLIFKEDSDLLPEFTLITYKAIVSQGDEQPNFKTWDEALKKTIDDIKNIDFDIALLSCGSYGLPLGSEIKKMNKQVIQVCGPLPLLFGIRGKVWDKQHCCDKFINEHWIYPSDKEKPNGHEKIEGSCYW